MGTLRLLALFLPCLALPALSATPGPRAPLTATSGVVTVTVSTDTASASGPFPLVLPFSVGGLIFGCEASGTATLDDPDGVIELRLESVTLGGAGASCAMRATATVDDLELEVPDIGDAITPVYSTVTVDSTVTGAVAESTRSGSFGGSYDSALLGASLAAAVHTISVYDVVGPALYVAGDTVSGVIGSMTGRWVAPSGFGTLDATGVLETFVPPTGGPPAPSTSPSARIALAAALLAVAGLVGLRRRRRALHGRA